MRTSQGFYIVYIRDLVDKTNKYMLAVNYYFLACLSDLFGLFQKNGIINVLLFRKVK